MVRGGSGWYFLKVRLVELYRGVGRGGRQYLYCVRFGWVDGLLKYIYNSRREAREERIAAVVRAVERRRQV